MVERKFDAVVFDLDGTLLDTIEDLQQSVNKVMKELDLLGFTIDEIKRMVGLGVDILIRQVIDKRQIDDDLFDWVKNRYLWYYRSSSKNLTKPYLGIVNLLEDLEKNKIKMAVLSNKPDPETKEVVNHYFPHIAFSCVIGKKAEFPIKPNPASLEYVISELKTSKERILYVGDTGTDMETAANASLVSAGVLWGFRDKVELQGSGANYIIEKPEEISFLILGG